MENELIYEFSVDKDVIMERFSLCRDRLQEMKDEHLALSQNKGFDAYFHSVLPLKAALRPLSEPALNLF